MTTSRDWSRIFGVPHREIFLLFAVQAADQTELQAQQRLEHASMIFFKLRICDDPNPKRQ